MSSHDKNKTLPNKLKFHSGMQTLCQVIEKFFRHSYFQCIEQITKKSEFLFHVLMVTLYGLLSQQVLSYSIVTRIIKHFILRIYRPY